ncbi:MAG: 4-hydroxyphenylacetate 3-hydroxylase family protein [Peptococcaceae bacterium]|nr:4-hydroxyphenylacetate 3-hydroxylase family protein [Peptococcaceae bacterium]
MRTVQQYIDKLRSMRPNVYMGGRLVPRDDPRFMGGIRTIATTIECGLDPQYSDLMTARSHLTGKTINRYTHVHQSVEDLLKKQEMTRFLCRKVGGCIDRCMGIDATNALSVVTKDCDNAHGTDYHQRFLKWLEYFQENDLVAACAQTDVKGDRSKRPHEQADPDLYVHVVEKRDDGIIVRGAKNHISIVPYADEIIVVPTRALTQKDADYAVAFAIPADAEGVKLVTRATGTRERKILTGSVGQYQVDCYVIFEDTFVPWERVFLCGEHMFGGMLALMFALYHRHSYTGCKPAVSDCLMGQAALVAEYNGIEKAHHVREKLADYVAVAELVYGAGIASAVKARRAASGTYVPDPVYVNVARYHAGVNLYHEFEMLADLSGGLPATLPPEEDFFSPETGPLLHKYIMRNPKISAENQHRLFRLLSDTLCSAMGGVAQVGGMHGGGSPVMEKIGIMAAYDIEARKRLAKQLAGIRD